MLDMTNIAHLPVERENSGNSTVAANVRAEIAYAGSTQGQLASAIGMTGMSLSRRLRDETEFTASEIVAIAVHFGIEPGELFKRRDRPTLAPAEQSPTRKGQGMKPAGWWFESTSGSQTSMGAVVTPMPARAIAVLERDELASVHQLRSAS